MLIPVLAAALMTVSAGSGSAPAIERFFIGTTEGTGTAKVIASGKHAVRDRSHGRIDAEGTLILEQTVEEEGKPARRRSWRLLRSGNRISGTINDVKGAVTGEITDTTLHLKYRMKEGPSVEQWIALRPDGRTATNRMTYHRFGLKVATVETEIRRVD